jgi:hypothetical protein
MEQVCYPKKGSGMGCGIQPGPGMDRYAFAATSLEEFPLTEEQPLNLAQTLDRLAQDIAACLPTALIGSATTAGGQRVRDAYPTPLRSSFAPCFNTHSRATTWNVPAHRAAPLGPRRVRIAYPTPADPSAQAQVGYALRTAGG